MPSRIVRQLRLKGERTAAQLSRVLALPGDARQRRMCVQYHLLELERAGRVVRVKKSQGPLGWRVAE